MLIGNDNDAPHTRFFVHPCAILFTGGLTSVCVFWLYVFACQIWNGWMTLERILQGAWGLFPLTALGGWFCFGYVKHLARSFYWARNMKMDSSGLCFFERFVAWQDIDEIAKPEKRSRLFPDDNILVLRSGERVSIPIDIWGWHRIKKAVGSSRT